MWKNNINTRTVLAVALVAAVCSFTSAQEAELLEVLRSDATFQAKSAACRELARIATKESVPTLASMLGDEQLSHMARYALEPIRDPAVDEALRAALGTVTGRPLLGVIGSLGVRRDAQAIEPLAALMKQADTVQAAARALGSISTIEAVEALEGALPDSGGTAQRAICEGLFRCAEQLAEAGQREAALGIYDRLCKLEDAPAQVRLAALRGAILERGADGVPLLVKAIHGDDKALIGAVARVAMESSIPEIGDGLVAELPKVTPERQGLLMMALAARGDTRILPVVLKAANGDDASLRILAFRALKRVGDASCVPALLDAASGENAEVVVAALDVLENLQGESVDEQLIAKLAAAEGKMRLTLLNLVGRRRTVAAAPALWAAADDADAAVRAAALAGLGTVADAEDLPKLIERLTKTKDASEASSLDSAIRSVCSRSEDQEAVAAKVAAALPTATAEVKSRILDTLNVIGGTTSLKTVAAAAKSDDEQLRDAASRVLGQWKSASAAPVLMDLYKSADDDRTKIRAIRAYIRIARQFDMPADQRAEMCRTALDVASRDEDKQLVLEVLLRYPSEEMQEIALKAAEIPALKEQATLVVMGMASKGINRAELGKALAQAGQKPVELEIVKAVYGAGEKVNDVTAILREHAKSYRIIFLPSSNYNSAFGGDPAPDVPKQLKVQYRVNGKPGEVVFSENAMIVLPMPR